MMKKRLAIFALPASRSARPGNNQTGISHNEQFSLRGLVMRAAPLAAFLALALVGWALVGLAAPQDAWANNDKTPYWATINTTELNMRVGPSKQYKIAWVYKRKGLPVKVVRDIDGWWLIRDHEGVQGWVVSSLCSKRRGAMVIGEGLAAIREKPRANSKLRWNAEPGVVGRLNECENGYCEVDVMGRMGWIEQSRLWGAGEP